MPEFFTGSSIEETARELVAPAQEARADAPASARPMCLGLDSRGKAGAFYGTPDVVRHFVVARSEGFPTQLTEREEDLVRRLAVAKSFVYFNTRDERLDGPGGPGCTSWVVWRSHAPRLCFQGHHVGVVPTRPHTSTGDINALPDGRVIANETIFPGRNLTLDARRVPLEARNFTFYSRRHMGLLLADHPDSTAIQEAVADLGLLVPRATSSHGGLRARPPRQRARACA